MITPSFTEDQLVEQPATSLYVELGWELLPKFISGEMTV
jgi:hypothetical protein